MMRMWQGAVGGAPEDGLISPAYVVATPLDGTDSRYFAYLFRTGAYMSEVNKYSHGIVTDRNRLYWDEFKQMPSPFPPPEEQKAIADYLDRKDMEIREFIRNKRRLVALLNERKLMLVNEAVTKGIDPNVKLKPSGIDWLGDIPEHWVINRIKTVAANITEQTFQKDPDDVYIALESVESWTGKITTNNTDTPFVSQVKRFVADDVLFGKLRPYLAKVVKAKQTGVCVGEFLVLRLKGEDITTDFFEHTLRSLKFIDLINSTTFGAKMPRAEWAFIGNVNIAYPDNTEEQFKIIEYVKDKINSINTAIQRAEREIELIEEYHTTLICDAVFGRLDVRHLAKPEKRRKPNVHFCRSVLAAEIVDRHRDTPRFGWIKLQKAILLAERHLELEEIQSRPVRAAAGPFDNAMMRSVHAQMKRSKWFDPQRQEGGGIAYLPMEKCGAHRDYFDRYWGDRKTSFDRLMELIHPMKTEQIEIVATLYAAWNDFLIQGEMVDDDRLLDEVLNRWDASKKRISEDRWRSAIDWMREKNLVPKGYGRATERAQDGDC
jgi:type I restriction enzyme S subunit